MVTIEDEYFNWMLGKIFCGDSSLHEYTSVSRELNNVMFEFDICTDENRQKDAQDLRYLFGNENGYFEM